MPGESSQVLDEEGSSGQLIPFQVAQREGLGWGLGKTPPLDWQCSVQMLDLLLPAWWTWDSHSPPLHLSFLSLEIGLLHEASCIYC